MTARILAIAVLAAVLSACASSPGSESALDDFRTRQATAAEDAERDGKLREALTLWQTVITAEPGNSEAIAAIQALQSAIESQTRNAISEGKASYARGDNREGDRWMLRALALSPQEPTALTALRLSVSQASHRRQEEKVESAYAGLEEEVKKPAATRDPGLELQRLFDAGDYDAVLRAAESDGAQDEEGTALVRESHTALAGRARDAKQPERQLMHLDKALAMTSTPGDRLRQERQQLAEELSDDYYRRSLALLKSDLDAAVVALETAIELNPGNIVAIEKLDQAQTLKRNLKKIQGR